MGSMEASFPMENALLIGLSRQVALGRELNVVANNVANIETNGFKRRSSVFQEYISPTARAEAFAGADRQVSYVVDQGTTLDFSAGGRSKTDNPLDIAIKGDGLFVVRTPAGDRYTRDGSFNFNSRGELVTGNGQPVLTDQGTFRLNSTERDFKVAADGQITTSEGLRGRLRVVQFNDLQSLSNVGSNLFSSNETPRPAGNTITLEAGSVEKSNVNAVLEMSRLIEINRSYQAVSTIMGQTDQLRRTAIQKLADLTT